MLEMYFNEYVKFSLAKTKSMDKKNDYINILLDTYDCSYWFEKETVIIYSDKTPNSDNIPSMPPLELALQNICSSNLIYTKDNNTKAVNSK